MEQNTGKQQNQTFQLSVNRHHRDKTVGNPKHYRDCFKTKELTINELAEAVKRGHAWSCATYDHSMRSKGNYQQAQLIGLDIDNGLTLNDALNHPFVKQYGQLIYTSASHQKPKGDKETRRTRGQGGMLTENLPYLPPLPCLPLSPSPHPVTALESSSAHLNP